VDHHHPQEEALYNILPLEIPLEELVVSVLDIFLFS
jgi:hypothetical protein